MKHPFVGSSVEGKKGVRVRMCRVLEPERTCSPGADADEALRRENLTWVAMAVVGRLLGN